jgi:type IV pilus assembly protein PilB
MEAIHQDHIQLGTEMMQAVTVEQAWQYRIIPKSNTPFCLECYCDSEELTDIKDELEVITGKEVRLIPTDPEIIQKTLSRYYLRQQQKENRPRTSLDAGSEDFISRLISDAKDLNSSDIHIECYEERSRVRIRIDGQMVERHVLKNNEYPSLVNKIKIMANLDIAEKRLPQDGRIFYKSQGRQFDIRVSIMPTLHGEKVVLRILGSDASHIDIAQLGFSEFDLTNYLEGIKSPNGILLISGPTGSGKTTTLYATLKLLNKESRNILTIEDPIEYTLQGINQVQLKENIGLDFAKALRTFLRQDPDVIMVGEIRDTETANMAIRAALTGHLVLSTIHTNSAWGATSRLIDMGVPAYLLANTLNTAVAQRLIRLACPFCKQEEAFNPQLYPKNFKPFKAIHKHSVAKGCEHCFHTGYKGRKAVYEVIPVDHELSDKIKSAQFDIKDDLKIRGIKTLAENAFELFEKGETTIDEIYPLLFNY